MKQPRKPQRNEKIFLSKKGLKPENWAVLSKDKESITFIHKTSKKTRKFQEKL